MNETQLLEYMIELFDDDPSRFFDLLQNLSGVKEESKDRASYLLQEYGKDKIIVAMLGENLLVVRKPEGGDE